MKLLNHAQIQQRLGEAQTIEHDAIERMLEAAKAVLDARATQAELVKAFWAWSAAVVAERKRQGIVEHVE